MRGNLFANTPDILPEFLQIGGRPAFMIRLVLAATLGATYGIYGPPFEQCVGTPVRPGSEEYLDSEKYQVRHWDLDAPWSLRDYIARVNEIRRENPALHYNRNLRFFDDRQRRDHLLRQVDARPVEPDRRHRQPRPVPHAVGLGAAPGARAEPGLRPGRVVPGPRPDQRRPLPLARRGELRASSTPTSAPRTSSGSGGRSGPSRFRLLHVERIDSSSDDYPERLRPAPHRRGDPRPALREARAPTSSTSTARPGRISPSGPRTPARSRSSASSTAGTRRSTPCRGGACPASGRASCPAIGQGTLYKYSILAPDGGSRFDKADPYAFAAELPPGHRLEGLGPRRTTSGATPTGWPTAPPASR